MHLIDRLVILGLLLWVGGMVLERVAAEFVRPPPPPVDFPVETLPRGEPDPDGLPDLGRGRVGELYVQHPRRGEVQAGTAWQVGVGVWLSARHVVENCHILALGPVQRPPLSRLWRHPDADLAAIESAALPRVLELAAAPPRAGEVGYGVGFPSLRPGVVELTLVGATRTRLTGALPTEQPFRSLLWRVQRLPGHVPNVGELGGISGGVVLDRGGRAVGVAFSALPRRAFMGTIPYADVRRAVEATGARPILPAAAHGAAPDVRALATQLFRDGTVSQVVCQS